MTEREPIAESLKRRIRSWTLRLHRLELSLAHKQGELAGALEAKIAIAQDARTKGIRAAKDRLRDAPVTEYPPEGFGELR